MGTFTEQLVVKIHSNSDMPYEVREEFEFHSGLKNSGLFVRCEFGFRYNGTSIPRGFRWLISPGDPDLLQCAAGHDKPYRTGTVNIRIGGSERIVPVDRRVADGFMAEMMKARKVAKWKQVYINTGLSLFGWVGWRMNANKRKAFRTDTTR